MPDALDRKELEKIASVLGAIKVIYDKDHYRIKVVNDEEKRSLTLQIYTETQLGRERGMLIVVYAGNVHLQLHNCTGYVVSDELGEVTFVAEAPDRLSGLVVERGASCSSYAAMSRELISSDFTQLGVEAMLSGVAMSLAEEILSSKKEKE
jgi:signal transduction protein with GAF and PtsI domain